MQFHVLLSFIFLLAVPLFGNLLINKDLDDEWQIYKSKYDKTYSGFEEYSRRLIWEENLKYIQAHNLRYDLGEHSHFLGINQFADMTPEEFSVKYLRPLKGSKQDDSVTFLPPLNMEALPSFINWTSKGYVTPVKNQGQCGSCWSFSTTGAVEGQYYRKYHQLVSFSEQQLVDCSGPFGPQGCNGGWMDDAFRYIGQYGLEREQDYPYHAVKQNCRYNASKVVKGSKVAKIVDVQSNSESQLAIAVATQGPIAVAIDASSRNFQLYKGGIYNQPGCSTTMLDHAVLAVGYDDRSSQHYWIVKNSWSPAWGVHGYIFMSKDKNNQCGIASKASYPLL